MTVTAVAFGLFLPSTVVAHPQVQRGVEHLNQADFEGALEALDAAYGAETLKREELVRLLLYRALARHALGQHAAMRSDLARLALLAPNTSLPRFIPPEATRAFARARGRRARIQLDLGVERLPGGTRVEASLAHDPAGLARRVRVATRVHEQPWKTQSGATRVEVVRPTGGLDYYAEVLGPGGVVLTQRGSADAPLHLSNRSGSGLSMQAPVAGPRAPASATAPLPGEKDEGEGISPWWIAGTGAAITVTTVAVLVGVLASGSGSAQTHFDAPYVTP